MPTYEYKCSECGEIQDSWSRMQERKEEIISSCCNAKAPRAWLGFSLIPSESGGDPSFFYKGKGKTTVSNRETVHFEDTGFISHDKIKSENTGIEDY